MRLALLANAAAGSADDDTVRTVRDRWDGEGATSTRYELGSDDVPAIIRRAWGDGADRLVVAGGDGTLHQVLASMHRSGLLSPQAPVAVLPLGTGNDLALGAGLPTDPAAAAAVALSPATRRMDVLVDDRGTVVVNAAHCGVGALAAERAAAAKDQLGPLGYAVGAVLAGLQARGWPMRVEVDGHEVVRDELLMLGLAVGRTIGGGTPLAPDARPDDGLVDVVLVGATGPVARVDAARRLRRGEHPERDDVAVLTGRTVRVEADAAPLDVDGELLGDAGSRTWVVEPGAWSLVVPE